MSEKKEPPKDHRYVMLTCGNWPFIGRRTTDGTGWQCERGIRIFGDVVDWCEIPEWPDLVAAPGAAARLAEAQARIDKAQVRILELEDENATMAERLQEALSWKIRVAVALDCVRRSGEVGDADYVERHATALRRFAGERDEALARAERAESALSIPREGDVGYGDDLRVAYVHEHSARFKAESERDRALAERDEARAKVASLTEAVDLCADRLNAELAARPLAEVCPHCGPGTDLNTALNELADTRCELMGARERAERAESQRDELGCQLEALRAVQRDDLQVVVARLALVEADVARLKGDDSDAGLEGLVFEKKGGE